MNIYVQLAQKLDALPNGFPSTGEGSELRLLEKLFTPEEASLAILLTPKLETVESIARRTGLNADDLRKQFKNMARHGLIASGKIESGLGFGLMPFIVGIYEEQIGRLDAELARLAEDYFKQAFSQALKIQPQFHRVVPIGENVRNSMEVHPYESASALVNAAQSWGVLDCICRKQKELIGEACSHPIDVCMAFYDQPGVFDNNPVIHAVSREEALATLERAAKAGLVHTTSNSKEGIFYICNCCTCSCGILRGMASLGMANVVARSAFVNTVDELLCNGCGECVSVCQFKALKVDNILVIDTQRCVGCGTCVPVCPSEALILVRRPEDEILPIPETPEDWRTQRSAARGQK
jgi:ferredoxin